MPSEQKKATAKKRFEGGIVLAKFAKLGVEHRNTETHAIHSPEHRQAIQDPSALWLVCA